MRRAWMAAIVVAAGAFSQSADAKIAITVDKDAQRMTVAVDGAVKYNWPVSSGLPSYETPNGSFQAFRMEEDHFSKEFDDAPMPHAVFFTKKGHAIHGTDSVSRLGSPASHGCVRLSRANAATLFALVKADGVMNTTVTLTGSSQVALARNPRGAAKQVARRDPLGDIATPDAPAVGAPEDITTARPLFQRRAAPQIADDGYIYPADGSAGRYPAPRGYRRSYDVQDSPYGGQQYYVDRGYGAQPYVPNGYYQRGW